MSILFYSVMWYGVIATICTLFSFFFNDTATTEIYTLSLHDALPIFGGSALPVFGHGGDEQRAGVGGKRLEDRLGLGFRHAIIAGVIGIQRFFEEGAEFLNRSEEHTSELQSLTNLVCRLLL